MNEYAYKVVEALSLREFEEKVAELYEQGFQCVGGIQHSEGLNRGIYYRQAMERLPLKMFLIR